MAFFAVSGALKAFIFGLTSVAAILLGALTGVRGVTRDILLAEIPRCYGQTFTRSRLWRVPL